MCKTAKDSQRQSGSHQGQSQSHRSRERERANNNKAVKATLQPEYVGIRQALTSGGALGSHSPCCHDDDSCCHEPGEYEACGCRGGAFEDASGHDDARCRLGQNAQVQKSDFFLLFWSSSHHPVLSGFRQSQPAVPCRAPTCLSHIT